MTSTTRIAIFGGLGALAMAMMATQATASLAVSGNARPAKATTVQYAACMVQGSGGRSYSCDSLGGGAYKGTKTKGHAQTKKSSTGTSK
jgi:hypothetical protein